MQIPFLLGLTFYQALLCHEFLDIIFRTPLWWKLYYKSWPVVFRLVSVMWRRPWWIDMWVIWVSWLEEFREAEKEKSTERERLNGASELPFFHPVLQETQMKHTPPTVLVSPFWKWPLLETAAKLPRGRGDLQMASLTTSPELSPQQGLLPTPAPATGATSMIR